MPSLVAEIGDAIENHMRMIGMLQSDLDEHQKAFIAKKKQELDAQVKKPEVSHEEDNSFPAGASLCGKCSTKAVVYMDGCMTCLNCGDSKCG